MKKLETILAVVIVVALVVVAFSHLLIYGLIGAGAFILGTGYGEARSALRHRRRARLKAGGMPMK